MKHKLSLTIHIKKFPLTFHWTIIFLLFIWSPNLNSLSLTITGFLSILFLIAVHEYGHYYTAKRLKYKVYEVMIHGFGGYCRHEEVYYRKDDVLISSAGVIAQSFVLCISVILWAVLKFTSLSEIELLRVILFDRFIVFNLIMIFLNLLPIPGLDGSKIWKSLDFKKFSKKGSKVKPKEKRNNVAAKRTPAEIKKLREDLMNDIIEKANKRE